MTNKSIEINGVSKRFGDVLSVDNITLSLNQGEMVGLIGHNGAGKSTLFKLMLGLIPASAGAVLVSGVSVASPDFRRVRRRIGYLPETFVTYDNLTGAEMLSLFADLKKVPRAACSHAMERVGLTHASGRRVRGYSKGMRQRLGFAQALLGEPDLIFLDEPTNGLDPEGIHDFYQILSEMRMQGTTIVITSHILAEIQERVDRLVILSSGRIAAQGTLAQLRERMELPSVIQIIPRPGDESRIHAVLCQFAGLELKIDKDCMRISCLPAQKIAVLNILAALADTVRDIAIHEPSLEDLFLGYGGLRGRQH